MSLLDKASLIVTPNAYKESKLYSVIPSDGSGDMTVVRATTATRINSSGLIESVATNVPRIDYTNGSCPSLLVEPQRTNLFTYSDKFDSSVWDNSSGVTFTSNIGVSPDGTQNADRLLGLGAWYTARPLILTLGNTYTYTIYVKSNTGSNQTFRLFSNGVNVLSPTLTANNQWQRFTLTFTANVDVYQGIICDASFSNADLLVWGAQMEAGAYATSYVPTVATSVTRNADVISKTGISSLIGQTEGTMFLDLKAQLDTTDVQDFSISDGTTNNRIIIRLSNSGIISAVGVFGGSVQFNIGSTSYTTGTRYKIALAYKNNDVALYINGTNVALTNTFTISGTLSRLGFDVFTNGAQIIVSPINSAQLYKTRLTNSELASLTNI